MHCGCGVWKVPRWTVLFGMAVKKGAGACLLNWLYQVQLSNPISAAHCCREVVCYLICSCDTGCISICFIAALDIKRLQSSCKETKSDSYLSMQRKITRIQYLHILFAQMLQMCLLPLGCMAMLQSLDIKSKALALKIYLLLLKTGTSLARPGH